MRKMKVYYYTIISSDKKVEDVYDEFPDEITCEGKKGHITFIKDTIEEMSDTVEYGEG